MENKRFVGFYNKSVILTYMGLGFAFCSIYLSLQHNFRWSIFCILLSGLCDMFDGPVARMIERNNLEKAFGIQIDSLCDLVCFGVAPAVLTISVYEGDDMQFLGYLAGFLITLCGVIRLAYFNVTEEERQKKTSERRTLYQGLPITCSSLGITVAYIVGSLLPDDYFPLVFSGFMMFVAFLFVFNFPMPKAHGKGLIPVIIGALLLFAGVLLL